MKRISKIMIALAMSVTLLFSTGCFGEFALTRKVYEFHDGIMGDDMVGKLVKTILLYIPGEIVYGISGFVDIIILNLIEFWTGSNPLAMVEGQSETQFVMYQGVQYQITATKNQFEFTALSGENAGKINSITFNNNDMAWYNTSNGNSEKLIQYQVEGDKIISAEYFGQNGQSFVINEQQMNRLLNDVASR